MYDGYEDRRGQGAVPLGNIGASLILDQLSTLSVAFQVIQSTGPPAVLTIRARAGFDSQPGSLLVPFFFCGTPVFLDLCTRLRLPQALGYWSGITGFGVLLHLDLCSK